MKGEGKGKRNRGDNRKCWRGVWDEKSRKKFRQRVGSLEIEGRELNEDCGIMEEKVKRAIKEIERERGKGKEKRRGW